MTDSWLSPEEHDAMSADAVALANSIVSAMLKDPEGPAARDLIGSMIGDMTRDLVGETIEEAAEELGIRLTRSCVVVEAMATMVVQVIRGAERAGITVNLDALASPYDVMSELDELEP
jgi:hypothetical protein